ncbi:MAG: DEAD/DEAH box helicase, partial [Planctomycetes bacterium]|nr:DEAD/DEAH box helicase [Planctomycetota bacterium]
LGKTAMVLHLLERLWWRSGCSLRVLVIAPLRVVYSVWPAEIEKWDLILPYQILHGKHKEELARTRKSTIDLLNVENVFWLLEQNWRLGYDVLVVDESSKFKNYASKRFKALKRRLPEFDRRIILTGTPSPNSLEDLFSQVYIMDQGNALGPNITAYRRSYFYPVSYRNFVEYQPQSGAADLIQRKIAPLVRRIDAETNLDLPELLENTISVELPAKARRIYDDFEKRLFAELEVHAGEEKAFALSSAAVAYNVCRQIANGRFYEPPKVLELAKASKDRRVISLHTAKIDALAELVGELQGKPLLVAYHYKHDLEQLLLRFGKKTPVIGGGVSAKEGARIVDRWNRGQIPLLFGHPQSMSHGINLQGAGNDVAWFALTDNLENYLQFVRRVYRQGIKGQVRVHHIIAKGTVDEAIMQRIKAKDGDQRALLTALAMYGNLKDVLSLQNQAVSDALAIAFG